MIRFLIRTAISAAGVLLVAYLGLITVDNFGPTTQLTWSAFLLAALFAIVLGLVNGIVKPLVQLFALPITVLTLGLFSLVINLAMFYLAAALIPGVHADKGFIFTAIAAIMVALVNGIASAVAFGEE